MAAATAIAGCRPTELEGSLSVLVNLEYREARVALTPEAVTVNFVRPQGEGENIVLQVTARLDGVSLESGTALDLAEMLDEDTQRGVIARNVLDDPRRSFPALERGRLQFNRVPAPGERVAGAFSSTFAQCTEFACGRTVFGDFEASVP